MSDKPMGKPEFKSSVEAQADNDMLLLDIALKMTLITEINELLESVMDWAKHLTGGDEGAILIAQDDGSYHFTVIAGLDMENNETHTLIAQALQKVVDTNSTAVLNSDEEGSEITENIRTVVASPLLTSNDLVGIIFVDQNTDERPITSQQILAFEKLGSIAAINYKRLNLLDAQQSELVAAMEALKKRNTDLQKLLDEYRESQAQSEQEKIRVFVSYSRNDEDFARKITATLINFGFDVWLDVERIPSGANWANTIHEGLTESSIMLLILTPDSMKSENVEREWQFYLNEVKKPVIPVLWDDCQRHFQLTMLQYIDFRSTQVNYNEAINQLERALKNAHTLENL